MLAEYGTIIKRLVSSNVVGNSRQLMNVFSQRKVLSSFYVDDACIISSSKILIKSEIISFQSDYDLTDDGELQDYLRTRFDRSSDGSVTLTLTQPRMSSRVLEIVGINKDENVKMHDTPATTILTDTTATRPRLQK